MQPHQATPQNTDQSNFSVVSQDLRSPSAAMDYALSGARYGVVVGAAVVGILHCTAYMGTRAADIVPNYLAAQVNMSGEFELATNKAVTQKKNRVQDVMGVDNQRFAFTPNTFQTAMTDTTLIAETSPKAVPEPNVWSTSVIASGTK